MSFLENSIYYLMWRSSIITSGLEIVVFDEDTLFDLRCLLVEHAGTNLRNRMAHGLISDSEFMGPLMSYICSH